MGFRTLHCGSQLNHRIVPDVVLLKKVRDKPHLKKRGFLFPRESGPPGAIPTRGLPFRSQSEDVYLRYLRLSLTTRSAASWATLKPIRLTVTSMLMWKRRNGPWQLWMPSMPNNGACDSARTGALTGEAVLNSNRSKIHATR